ncbi:MAG: hypothetical protein V2A73_15190 [Pseudomonadota bacterium]
MTGHSEVFSILLGLALALSSANSLAQERSRDKIGEARLHYQKGQSKYDLAEYESAIVEFKKAYELSDAPGLLFNIAQSHRLNGDCKQALRFYKNYLRRQPDAANRQEVEKLIADMQTCIDEKARGGPSPATTSQAPPDSAQSTPPSPTSASASAPAATPAAPATPELSISSAPDPAKHGDIPSQAATEISSAATAPLPDTSAALPALVAESVKKDVRPSRTGTWTSLGLVGTGGLLVASSVYFGFRVSSLNDEITALCPPTAIKCDGKTLSEKQSARDTAEINTWILGSVGAVAVASGAILYYYTGRRQSERASTASVSLESLPDGAAVHYSYIW